MKYFYQCSISLIILVRTPSDTNTIPLSTKLVYIYKCIFLTTIKMSVSNYSVVETVKTPKFNSCPYSDSHTTHLEG